MAKLIYITSMSLDGYIQDATGAFDWVEPKGVHEFVTDLVRSIRTYLYGRRMYETMSYWDSPAIEDYLPEHREFARVWQKAEKVVFSRTLAEAPTRRTRVERDFNVETVLRLKRESEYDITIGGAELASIAIDGGIVDECHLFLNPAIVGGGKQAFTPGLRRRLQLLGTRRFETGVVGLHYAIPPHS